VQPSTRLGNWYVHLARFGHQQFVLATSAFFADRTPAGTPFAALQLPAKIVSRELAAAQPISFAAASNRRVIGSMNEYVWQLGSYLTRTGDPLELSLQLNKTPMSAVGSKSSYGIPDEVARDLLMSWEQ
jgi:hypothetical protein